MKLTFALILALQVSVCVWAQDWPEPDKELIEKYSALREVFFKRLVVAWGKMKDAAQPLLDSSPAGEGAKEYQRCGQ